MNKITETYNLFFNQISNMINYLFNNTIVNDQKATQRREASFRELARIKKKTDTYEDNFNDFNKINEHSNTTYQNDGFSLEYSIKLRKFNKDYYSKSVYPMNMRRGLPIPGSRFSNIFKDNLEYWGYSSNESGLSSFEIKLNTKSYINKIRLSTLHDIGVRLYIKSDFEEEYLMVGSINGKEHVWDFWPQEVVILKFETDSKIFGVRYLAAGLAKYQTEGYILSKEYDIPDLYKLDINIDHHKPIGSYIESQGRIIPSGVLPSGIAWFDIEQGENLIEGVIDWENEQELETLDAEAPFEYVLGTEVIEDTIEARPGYQKWEIITPSGVLAKGLRKISVSYYDVPVNYDDVDKKHYIDLSEIDDDENPVILTPQNYEIPKDAVLEVYAGSRKFTENLDYGVKIVTEDNITKKGIGIDLQLATTEIHNVSELKAAIKLYIDKEFILARKYIHSSEDVELSINPSIIADTDHMDIRIVPINKTLGSEAIFKNIETVFTTTISSGINLLELVFYDNADIKLVPTPLELETLSNSMTSHELKYFATNTILKQVGISNVTSYTYYLNKERDGDSIITSMLTNAENIFVEYGKESPGNKFQLRFILRGTDGIITPILKGYDFINKVK